MFKNPKYDMLIEQLNFQPSSTISVANRKLTVTNKASCPKCHSRLALFDEDDKVSSVTFYSEKVAM